MSDQIRHMQRLQLAGTLAGGIAHGLNNELTLVLGNLDLALDQLPAGYEVCDSLEHAKSAASRCADMSRRLLSASRDRGVVMAKMDVAAAVLEARKLLEYIKPPRIHVNTETETGLYIRGNATQIQQAILSLATNAFQAMEEGGDLEIRAFCEQGAINISVRDTGCGMSPSQQRRAFEPFYTTCSDLGRGGLGLATVRSIVSDHEGLIALESQSGQGTLFILNFPPWQAEPEPSEDGIAF